MQQYDPPGIPGSVPTRYFYNIDRQLDSIVRPDSVAIAFGYDTAGRPSSVRFDRGTLTYGYSSTTGHLAAIRAPTGDSLAFSYDGPLPTAVRWKGAVNGSVEVGYISEFHGFQVGSQTVNGADQVDFLHNNFVGRDAGRMSCPVDLDQLWTLPLKQPRTPLYSGGSQMSYELHK